MTFARECVLYMLMKIIDIPNFVVLYGVGVANGPYLFVIDEGA